MWIEKAKKLQFGQKRKIPHCTKDASAYISNNTRGVSLHCFRCGTNEFKAHEKLSAKDYLRMRNKDIEARQRAYPEIQDLLGEGVPKSCFVWLLKAGITPERAKSVYGFGWDAITSRLVIPVEQNSKRVGWIARAFDNRKPKYLMPKEAAGICWYSTNGLRGNRKSVVVEDVLSAIRIKEAGYSCCALLGTSINNSVASMLSDKEVVGWFDGDEAGRQGYVKLRKALSPFGVEPTRIHTSKDPKMYSKQEIQEYIDGCRP